MKTYPYTHARVISLAHPSILRKSLFLLFSTIISYFAFAGPGGGDPNNGTPEFSVPLVLKTFNANISHKKIKLNWVTGHELDLNYFVIERSTNGKDFSQVAIVFAADNSNITKKYSYNDAIDNSARGIVYYRLKLIDTKSRFQYSAVRIIKMEEGNGGATEKLVQAYPNPVVNELRITVPESWQNKQVNYEVYNANGNLVKRLATANANQTETMSVRELGAGTYIVKAYTKDEAASERIVKK